MLDQVGTSQIIRFATFEVDLQAQELRKAGLRLKLSGQPFQVLAILLEQPGSVVTREELQRRMWPDTFVDVDHNLNTAINKIREALGDSSENPRFVETLPRRGYRFIGPITANGTAPAEVETKAAVDGLSGRHIPWRLVAAGALAAAVLLAVVLVLRSRSPGDVHQRALTRVTFDSGHQIGATWSPDGRFIAYGSDRGGKFDVWVQQASGGDPVQVTHGPGQNWQPDWSPDGKYIAYRSETGSGGIYVTPALGGAGLERQISSYGYKPRWSPDRSQILFQRDFVQGLSRNKFYVVSLDGTPPREILADFIAKNDLWPASAAWRRSDEVSFWVAGDKPSPDFWTVQISGHSGTKLIITPDVEKQLREAAEGSEFAGDFSFAWSASGRVVYFERNYRGARNIWGMDVDPEAFRATAVERLTTGPGPDNGVAVSADGNKLAFTANSEQVRSWLFPFDAANGRILGEGHAVSPSSLMAWEQDLSRDGKKLVFWGGKYGANKSAVYQETLEDMRESPVIADDRGRDSAHWSPDGTHLVYARGCGGGAQLMLWSAQTHTEEPLTGTCSEIIPDGDWSPDGTNVLATRLDSKTQHSEVWLVPISARPNAETASRRLFTCSGCDLWQPHFSPDARWIVFEAAAELPTAIEDKIYVAPAGGGPWTAITDGQQFADKPRWSPDGKTIYFLSQEDGYFNVWARRFEPTTGTPLGAPHRVTSFARPKFMIPSFISPVGFALTQDRLLLSIVEVSGSIWMLENLRR
jgi:Tol biopolymer transport system component/DNA-binding winged helix-turn-helix (wHTH) protein